jgi:hypothetical protein
MSEKVEALLERLCAAVEANTRAVNTFAGAVTRQADACTQLAENVGELFDSLTRRDDDDAPDPAAPEVASYLNGRAIGTG